MCWSRAADGCSEGSLTVDLALLRFFEARSSLMMGCAVGAGVLRARFLGADASSSVGLCAIVSTGACFLFERLSGGAVEAIV